VGNNNHAIITDFSSQQEQIFLGTMFGDSSLRRPRSNGHNIVFRGVHREADREYLFWKYEILKSSGIFKRPPWTRLGYRNGVAHLQWRFYSRALPIFTTYRKVFYPEGKKIVPREILKKLEPLGLAVWYMDDGGFWPGSSSRPNSRWVTLNTQSFTHDENTMIKNWLDEKFGFHFRVVKTDGGTGWKLRLPGKTETERWLDLLRPFMVPCMKRKFIGAEYDADYSTSEEGLSVH